MAKYRQSHPQRNFPAWMQSDFRNRDIHVNLSDAVRQYYRNWDFSGNVSLEQARLLVPAFPLQTQVLDLRGAVTNDFHALADGTGSETFLLTLAGEYLRLRYGLSISYSGLVLNPAEGADPAEVEDSFKTVFSGRKGELEKNVPAYHIQGRRMPGAGLRDIRVVMPMDRVKAVCRRMDCSVTDLRRSLSSTLPPDRKPRTTWSAISRSSTEERRTRVTWRWNRRLVSKICFIAFTMEVHG